MAEGFSPPPIVRHPDGVFLDLPLHEYVRDDAIGGSGAVLLAASPVDWRWQRPDNYLWKGDAEPSRARVIGSAVHAVVLEGLDAYQARYAVAPTPPEGALSTVEHLKAFLREKRATFEATLDGHKLCKEELAPFKLTGSREELVDRVLRLDAEAPVWGDDEIAAALAGRTKLSADEDNYIRLTHRLALKAYGDLLGFTAKNGKPVLDGGLSEVSVFWTDEEGVRWKSRFDRITFANVVELKKYGRPPRLQHSLRQHLVNEAAGFGYHVQTVLHAEAVEALLRIVLKGVGEVVASGEDARKRLQILAEIAKCGWSERRPEFCWLFLRCPGPPSGKPIYFRETDAAWSRARAVLEQARDNFLKFRDACGEDELWFDAQAAEHAGDEDWPNYAFGVPLEDRSW